MQESLSKEETRLLDPTVPAADKRSIRRHRVLRWWGGTFALMVLVVLLFPLVDSVRIAFLFLWALPTLLFD